MEDHRDVGGACQGGGERLEVITALRQQDRRSSLAEGSPDVVDDGAVAGGIRGELAVEVLDRRVLLPARIAPRCLADDEPLLEGSGMRRLARIDGEADGTELHVEIG